MSYTEVTRDSWGSRMGKAIGGVIVGIVMFVASFPLLFWNEGRAVQTAKSLEEGAASVVSVSIDKVDPSRDQKLVHMSGNDATEETLADPDFGISVNAIKLVRDVEMYQWKEEKKSETRKKVGGSTETVTTYDYARTWSSELISSGSFKESGHTNPSSMRFSSTKYTASKVTLGAFKLTSGQIEKLGNDVPLTIGPKELETVPSVLQAKAEAGRFYLGKDPGTPQIGDLRVKFSVVNPGPISVVAMQVGDSFQPYQTQAGDALLLVDDGTHSAAEMFKEAQSANTVLTWILRGVGFFLMLFGSLLVFRPISVMGDVIPIIGTLLGAGLGFFSFFMSLGLSILTIAIAWVAYRPLVGIPLLVLAVGAIVLVAMRSAKRRAAKKGAAVTARAA